MVELKGIFGQKNIHITELVLLSVRVPLFPENIHIPPPPTAEGIRNSMVGGGESQRPKSLVQ